MRAMTEYGFDHSRRRTFRAFRRTAENRSREAPEQRSMRQGTGAPVRLRPRRPSRGHPPPQNSPATVGPDPDTNPWSASAPRTAASAASTSGHSDTAAAPSSLTSKRSGSRPPGASVDHRSGSLAANCSSLSPTPRRSASAYTSGVDSRWGSGTITNACAASGALSSTSSPAPVPSTSPGESWLGTSEPSSAASASTTPSSTRATRGAIRSTAAASAEPPPMPAAIGMCFRTVT